MARRPRTVILPPSRAGVARFAQLASAITADIRRGRFTAGERLPGSRSLATELGLSRDTVLAAYAELVAAGWVRGEPRRGMVVADVRAEPARGGHGVAARAGFPLESTVAAAAARPPRPPPPGGVLALDSGAPDPRLAPVDLIARAYRRALRRHGVRVLGYSAEVAGEPRLRAALAAMAREERGIAARPEHVLVTRGSQMALDLIARALIRPGDVVAVEALGYRPAHAAFAAAGATVIGVPLDGDGLDVAALERLAASRPVRAVYLTPHHQYPTTVTLSAARRLRLLALARRARWAIIEDDYDHEFHYAGRPVLPLASDDPAGVVLYVGTLAKVLAPGVRIGYVVAPPPVIARLAAGRAIVDRQGDHAMELAIAELIEDDELGRHVRKLRRACEGRRDALVAAVARHLPWVTLAPPRGGMAAWLEVDPATDVVRWQAAARARGVAFAAGREFALAPRDVAALRVGFGAATERELEAGVRVMAATARRRDA